MDSSWDTFKQMLQYKANRMVEVDPYNTTVECSRCGNKVPNAFAVRIHECNVCGLILDRDHNATLNIMPKGLMLLQLPMRYGEVTSADDLASVAEAGTSPRLSGVDN